MGGIKKRRRGEGAEGWAEVGRQRQDNKSGGGGGIFTDDENKRFALCASHADGWQQSERAWDALKTHKIESEHHGNIQTGTIALFVFLCVHET